MGLSYSILPQLVVKGFYIGVPYGGPFLWGSCRGEVTVCIVDWFSPWDLE